MGRYYSGDIEGKFLFGSQSSNAADRFGVTGCEPNYIQYYYTEEEMPELIKELKVIEDSFGEHKTAIMAYFDLYGVDPVIGIREFITKADLPEMDEDKVREFYDYRIGKQILDCVKTHGTCSFEAEL